MERYVWELTRALAAMGHPVTVVCEQDCSNTAHDIPVHVLGAIAHRPRWLSLLRFGARVARWLQAHPQPGTLIHSHERLGVHHLTTFHGPPFATIYEREWWRRFSLRVLMQFKLERRELFSPGVRGVVPVSSFIAAQLHHYYPAVADRLTEPVAPGVAPGPRRLPRVVPRDGGIIGFVGKEWKRKGLDIAVAAVAALRRERPRAELWVAGPQPEEVRHLFSGWDGGYRLLGWCDGFAVYPQVDVLLHPARAEPYGMVVAEAMAAGVPVVVSDCCGVAANVAPDSGVVVPLEDAAGIWAGACARELARELPPPPFVRGWDEVAREYLVLYRQLARQVQPGA